jgi:hypothetical protein
LRHCESQTAAPILNGLRSFSNPLSAAAIAIAGEARRSKTKQQTRFAFYPTCLRLRKCHSFLRSFLSLQALRGNSEKCQIISCFYIWQIHVFRHCEEGAKRLTWQSIKNIQSLNYIYNRKFIFFVIASAHQQHTPYPFVIARFLRDDRYFALFLPKPTPATHATSIADDCTTIP